MIFWDSSDSLRITFYEFNNAAQVKTGTQNHLNLIQNITKAASLC